MPPSRARRRCRLRGGRGGGPATVARPPLARAGTGCGTTSPTSSTGSSPDRVSPSTALGRPAARPASAVTPQPVAAARAGGVSSRRAAGPEGAARPCTSTVAARRGAPRACLRRGAGGPAATRSAPASARISVSNCVCPMARRARGGSAGTGARFRGCGRRAARPAARCVGGGSSLGPGALRGRRSEGREDLGKRRTRRPGPAKGPTPRPAPPSRRRGARMGAGKGPYGATDGRVVTRGRSGRPRRRRPGPRPVGPPVPTTPLKRTSPVSTPRGKERKRKLPWRPIGVRRAAQAPTTLPTPLNRCPPAPTRWRPNAPRNPSGRTGRTS